MDNKIKEALETLKEAGCQIETAGDYEQRCSLMARSVIGDTVIIIPAERRGEK